MTDSMKTLTNVEILRVLRQHCRNEEEYYLFIWIFSYTVELNRLKENPEEGIEPRLYLLNQKLKYDFNKLNQMEKTNDQL